MKKEDLKDLRKELPLKWRVQSATQYGATCIPYIDARDQADLLDEVCTPSDWRDEYKMIGDHIVCTLLINIEGEWIGKSDTGKESNTEKEKGLFSDAFKRAGVKWGINRKSYETGAINLSAKEYKGKWYPVDEKGQFLKGDNLNKFCNEKTKILS